MTNVSVREDGFLENQAIHGLKDRVKCSKLRWKTISKHHTLARPGTGSESDHVLRSHSVLTLRWVCKAITYSHTDNATRIVMFVGARCKHVILYG